MAFDCWEVGTAKTPTRPPVAKAWAPFLSFFDCPLKLGRPDEPFAIGSLGHGSNRNFLGRVLLVSFSASVHYLVISQLWVAEVRVLEAERPLGNEPVYSGKGAWGHGSSAATDGAIAILNASSG